MAKASRDTAAELAKQLSAFEDIFAKLEEDQKAGLLRIF